MDERVFLGVILLFFGASVVPSLSANVVDVNNDNNVNNPGFKFVFIGSVNNLVKRTNYTSFNMINGIELDYIDGEFVASRFIKTMGITVENYDDVNGIITPFFICAAFIYN